MIFQLIFNENINYMKLILIWQTYENMFGLVSQ